MAPYLSTVEYLLLVDLLRPVFEQLRLLHLPFGQVLLVPQLREILRDLLHMNLASGLGLILDFDPVKVPLAFPEVLCW
jgi:hypothetical protein